MRLLQVSLVLSVLVGQSPAVGSPQERERPTAPHAWTLVEAYDAWSRCPRDSYLQFVVLQLSESNPQLREKIAEKIRWSREWLFDDSDNLFGLFGGSHAVQESLQLNTLLPDQRDSSRQLTSDADRTEAAASTAGPGEVTSRLVPLATLKGPSAASHPWSKLLAEQRAAGVEPAVSPLARCVPEDQYFVLFKSTKKLLETIDEGGLWISRLLQFPDHADYHIGRLKRQLAVVDNVKLRSIYDLCIEEVALTGGDLYMAEGSDLTLLCRIRQPELFRLHMDSALQAAAVEEGAVRAEGEVGGVAYVHVTTPNRSTHVYSAYPSPDLHVRSNSKVGLTRVLQAVARQSDVKSLGETDEFCYIRTKMPRGDAREDGICYLSDSFMRRMLGPEVKLTELRRLQCRNQLQIINHCVLFYRTQHGEWPKSLKQLIESDCVPDGLRTRPFTCPCGGSYVIGEHGMPGSCSHHGELGRLVPCCEIPIGEATEHEKQQYTEFVERYDDYWREYFDPIVLRIQLSPVRCRLETLVLPLINNSAYTALAENLAGETHSYANVAELDDVVFHLGVQWDKEQLKTNLEAEEGDSSNAAILAEMMLGDWPGELDEQKIQQFLLKGISNELHLNVCDFQLPAGISVDGDATSLALLGFVPYAGALLATSYIAIPVEDRAIVEQFIRDLDGVIRVPYQGSSFQIGFDYYPVPIGGRATSARCCVLQYGPVRFRFYFALADSTLYISNSLVAFDKICCQSQPDAGPAAVDHQEVAETPAHAVADIHLDRALKLTEHSEVALREKERRECLANTILKAAILRATGASGPQGLDAATNYAREFRLTEYGCPVGGEHHVASDGKTITCTVHGSFRDSRQPADRPVHARIAGKPRVAHMRASLTFLEEGLRAVLTVHRQPQAAGEPSN